jgi:hypothetical protein
VVVAKVKLDGHVGLGADVCQLYESNMLHKRELVKCRMSYYILLLPPPQSFLGNPLKPKHRNILSHVIS